MTLGLRPFVSELWRAHRADMLVVVAASAALLLTEGVGLLLLIPMLRLVGVSLGDGVSDRIAMAVEAVLRRANIAPTLVGVLLTVVLLVAARAALQLLLAWWDARLEASVVGRLRQRLFSAVVALPWARFAGERPAALMHAIGPQVDDVHSALLLLLQGVSLCASVVAAAVVAVAVSPLLTAVVAVVGVGLLGVTRALRAPGRAEGDQLLAASSGLFARIAELLGGMKMIHAHGAEARAVAAVADDTRVWSVLTQRYARRRATISFVLALAGVALLAALVWGAVVILQLAPATLLLLLLIYARIVPRVTELQSLASGLSQCLASYDSVSALLRRAEAARAGSALSTPPIGERPPGSDLPRVARAADVAVQGLVVAYAEGERNVLNDLSARFPAGDFTVVMGASGVGKTTLADVLLGLIEPTHGTVLIDGEPLSGRSASAWRARVGYLAQEPMLFHGTIRENLLFARPEASEREVIRALRAAACDFVDALPQGIDAPVGERGVMLSGGERQRIALARALLRQPELLVLDEATSALDAESERRVLDTVRALKGACTIVFFTHRSAVRDAADHVIGL